MLETNDLRDLGDTLEHCQWHHPINAPKLCWDAAEEIEKLRDALETLMDEQNGAPLHRQARQWHAAMAEGCRLTGRTDGEKRHREAMEE